MFTIISGGLIAHHMKKRSKPKPLTTQQEWSIKYMRNMEALRADFIGIDDQISSISGLTAAYELGLQSKSSVIAPRALLTGLPSSGKSSIAQRLGEILGKPTVTVN
jgi:hypothetical protein